MHSSPRDWTAAILSLLAFLTMNCRNFKDSRMLLPVLSLVLDAEIISLLSYRAFIGYLSLTGSGTNFCSWSSKLSMNMFPLILIASYSPTRPAAPSGLPHKSLSGFHHSVHAQVSMAKGHSPLLGRHYGTLFLQISGMRPI